MYELATKKEPANEELLSALFMSYVRQGMYKKQQQAALQLFKAKPKNPYYFWAVMSIVLQAISAGGGGLGADAGGKILLQLAEKMIVKMEKDKMVEQEQASRRPNGGSITFCLNYSLAVGLSEYASQKGLDLSVGINDYKILNRVG
jgi:hypothetical protein